MALVMAMVDAAAEADLFTGRAWFALVAQPGRQAQARDELATQGYGAFLPMCVRERKNGRIVEAVERPLFDRYLFCGVDIDGGQPFGPVNHTRGVAFVVRGTAGTPCRVPVPALRRVKERCDRDGGMVDLRPGGRMLAWSDTTELQVTDGPLQGLIAVFSGPHGNDAARVVVSLFGRPTPATIPLESLEAAAF